MKPILLGLFLFYLSLPGVCQKNEVLKLDEFFLPEKIPLPFKAIVVKDARFDKTKIGCIVNKAVLGFHTSKKYNAGFPDSLHLYLPQMVEGLTFLDKNSNETLYILVKKFRVAENLMTSLQETLNDYLTLKISASFYSMSDGKLTKLFSVDDLQSEFVDMEADVKFSLQHLKNQRSSILTKMLYKIIAYSNWKTKARGNSFNQADMDSAIQKRFTLPVYTQQPISGLYKNFEEFKAAVPMVRGITIKYKDGKIKDVFDAAGKEIIAADYWGLSDGKNNFLSFRNEFTELIPCDKSFRVLSFRTQAELTGRAVMGDSRYSGFLSSFSGGKKIDEYFDLDMDTGELFMEEVFGKSKLKNTEPLQRP